AGVLRDALRTGDTALNYDWDAVWDAAVRVDGSGWAAEVAIPLTALRFPEVEVSDWKMEIRRSIPRKNEADEWVYIPRAEQGELLRYAKILGLNKLPAPHGLELMPFVLGRVRNRTAPSTL